MPDLFLLYTACVCHCNTCRVVGIKRQREIRKPFVEKPNNGGQGSVGHE